MAYTEAQKRHYEKNKQQYLARAKATTANKKRMIAKLKAEPCMDCGQSYHPAVMQFHHRAA
jgi:methionyl-tRNA synthetase